MNTKILEQAMNAVGNSAKLSRDGSSVVVSYGNIGFLRLVPTSYTVGGRDVEGLQVVGRLVARNGAHHADLLAKLRAASIVAYN